MQQGISDVRDGQVRLQVWVFLAGFTASLQHIWTTAVYLKFICFQWLPEHSGAWSSGILTDDPLHHVIHLPGLLLLSPPAKLHVADHTPDQAHNCRQQQQQQQQLWAQQLTEATASALKKRRMSDTHWLQWQGLCWWLWGKLGENGTQRASWDVWTLTEWSQKCLSLDHQWPVRSACKHESVSHMKY